MKDEKREKILKFTKRNYIIIFKFIYYLFFHKNYNISEEAGESLEKQYTFCKIIESEKGKIVIKLKDGNLLIISFENEEGK